MFSKSRHAAAAALVGCLLATAASASPTWPASIVGNWSGFANNSQITLTVAQQVPGGKCQSINGSVQVIATGEVDVMAGFYCPAGGTLAFTRNITGTPGAFQVFTASLSQLQAHIAGGSMMAGSFGEYDNVGKLGQFGFSLFH